MSVTAAKGFRASGVTAGLKASGNPDVALVVNDGLHAVAAAVFTSNRVFAAPVQWSREALESGTCKAVILNSGGANACTGAQGFSNTVTTAEKVASLAGIDASDVAVCSTGLIGKQLPMDILLPGVDMAYAALDVNGGEAAATAIMTTDSVAKMATCACDAEWTIGGMAKGAGMLAPGLATMLVVITTDAVIAQADLQQALTAAVNESFNRIDSDGCMSTNDTVIAMSSGASGVTADIKEFTSCLTGVCMSLARQLIADAEGATKDIQIIVNNAASEDDAVEVARAVSRSNLLKCAIHGEDPNWGRVLSSLGTTSAAFEADHIDVSFNGVAVCKQGACLDDEPIVDLSDREVEITINLNAGNKSASLWTNDLTAMYVHENSAYST